MKKPALLLHKLEKIEKKNIGTDVTSKTIITRIKNKKIDAKAGK